MKIDRFRMTIDPWEYGDTTDKVLLVTIETPDEKYNIQKIVPNNDIESLFNQIWQLAGYEMEQYLKRKDRLEKEIL